MSERLSAFDYEFLYGRPGVHYSGLLSAPAPRKAWPDTMTRQRRRAAARQSAKRLVVHWMKVLDEQAHPRCESLSGPAL